MIFGHMMDHLITIDIISAEGLGTAMVWLNDLKYLNVIC